MTKENPCIRGQFSVCLGEPLYVIFENHRLVIRCEEMEFRLYKIDVLVKEKVADRETIFTCQPLNIFIFRLWPGCKQEGRFPLPVPFNISFFANISLWEYDKNLSSSVHRYKYLKTIGGSQFSKFFCHSFSTMIFANRKSKSVSISILSLVSMMKGIAGDA